MDAVVEYMNLVGKGFVDYALEMLIQSSVLVLILLVVDSVLRKKVRAIIRYWLWMLVLAKLVLPASLSSPVSLGSLFGDKFEDIRTVSLAEVSRPEHGVEPVGAIAYEPDVFVPPVVGAQPRTSGRPVVPELPAKQAIPAQVVTSLTWQAAVFLVWIAVVLAMGLLLVQRAFFVRGLVAMGDKAEQYPETLVSVAKLAFERPALSLRFIGVVESQNALKGRIKRILNRPIPKSAKLGIVGLAVILLAAAIALPMADTRTSLHVNQDSTLANFPDLVGSNIIEWHGLSRGFSVKYIKDYEQARRALDAIFGQDGNLFNEEIYKQSKQGFEGLVRNSQAYPLSLYAQRWTIILEWLAEKQDGLSTAQALNDLAEIQSNKHEANLTDIYATIILARDGYMKKAVQAFVKCHPELTPQWGWFVFEINKYFNEYVKQTAPNVTRQEGTTFIQEARTQVQWQEIEKPLRQAQVAYADYIEHQLLPLAARYITSESAKDYSHIERIQIINSLMHIQASHLSSFGLGATTKPISKRVKTSIRPKVLAVLQKSLILLEDEKYKDSFKAYSDEIRLRCRSYNIPFESLGQYWNEVISTANETSTKAKSDWKELTLPDMDGSESPAMLALDTHELIEIQDDSDELAHEQWIEQILKTPDRSYLVYEYASNEAHLMMAKALQFSEIDAGASTRQKPIHQTVSKTLPDTFSMTAPDGQVYEFTVLQADSKSCCLRYRLHSGGKEKTLAERKEQLAMEVNKESTAEKVRNLLYKTNSVGDPFMESNFASGTRYISTLDADLRVKALIELATNGSESDKQELLVNLVNMCRVCLEDLPLLIDDPNAPLQPWQATVMSPCGSKAFPYLLTYVDEDASTLGLLVRMYLRMQKAIKQYHKVDNDAWFGSKHGVVFAYACDHFLNIYNSRLDLQKKLSEEQLAVLKKYSDHRKSRAKDWNLDSRQCDVMEFAVAFVEAALMGPEHASYAATLVNGVTVELVGVCEYPIDDKQWWGADGSLLKGPLPVTQHPGSRTKMRLSKDQKSYKFFLRVSGLFDKSIRSTGQLLHDPTAIQEPLNLRWSEATEQGIRDGEIIARISKTAENTGLRLGFATKSWKTKFSFRKRWTFEDLSGAAIVESIKEKSGQTSVQIRHNYHKNAAVQIAAVGKDEKTYRGTRGMVSVDLARESRSLTTKFNMPLSEIREFQFQTRPFEWVTFKNVSLKPGFKTAVQVDAESSRGEAVDVPKLRYEVGVHKVVIPAGGKQFFNVELFNDGQEVVSVYWGDRAYHDQYRFVITDENGKELHQSQKLSLPPLDAVSREYFKDIAPGGFLKYSVSVKSGGGGRNGQSYYFRQPGKYTVRPSFLAIFAQLDNTVSEETQELKEVSTAVLDAEPVTFVVEDVTEDKGKFGDVEIRGQVVDANDKPIPNVTVLIQSKRNPSTALRGGMGPITNNIDEQHTDKDGRFAFTRLPDNPPLFVLLASHGQYYQQEQLTVVNDPKKKTYQTRIVMAPGLTIRGTVTDSDEQPVSRVHVRAYQSDTSISKTTYTNSQGQFEISGIGASEKGTVRFSLYKKGHLPGELAIPEEQIRSGPVKMTFFNNDDLAFSGRAVFPDGAPAAAMSVNFVIRRKNGRDTYIHHLDGGSKATDSQGRFKAVLHTPDSYSGMAWIAGPAKGDYIPRGKWQTSVEGISPGMEDVELVFENRGRIDILVEPANKLPASKKFEISCRMIGSGYGSAQGIISTKTLGPQGGMIAFENLTKARYEIRLKDLEAEQWNWSRQVSLPDEQGSLQKQVDFLLPEMHFGRVRARVFEPDGKTLASMDRARVWISSVASGPGVQISQGLIEADKVPVGRAWLNIDLDGYAPSRVSNIVRADETTDFGDITLVRIERVTRWVEGRILYEDGSPAIGALYGSPAIGALLGGSKYFFHRGSVREDGSFRQQLSEVYIGGVKVAGQPILMVALATSSGWPRASAPASINHMMMSDGTPWNLAREWGDTILIPLDVKPSQTVTKDIVVDRTNLGSVNIKWLGNPDKKPVVTLIVQRKDLLFICSSQSEETRHMGTWRMDSVTSPWSEQGALNIENVPTGRRTVILMTEDYYGCKVTRTAEKNSIFIFDPKRTSPLHGKVVHEDGRVVCNVRIELCHESLVELGIIRARASDYQLGPYGLVLPSYTQEDGSFRFGRVEPGRYLIKALNQAPPTLQIVEVKPSRDTIVELTISSPVNSPPPLREPSTSSE